MLDKIRRRLCETSAQRAARAAELEQRAAALEDRAWRTRTGEAPIWESVTDPDAAELEALELRQAARRERNSWTWR